MSSSFSRDSTPLFGSHIFKGNLQRWFNFKHCHFYLWGARIFWVKLNCGLCAQRQAEHFKTSWGSLQPSNKQPQKSWGRCTHNERMLSETPSRLLRSCGLHLLLCSSSLPTTSCHLLPFYSGLKTRSSIHRSKGRDFLW